MCWVCKRHEEDAVDNAVVMQSPEGAPAERDDRDPLRPHASRNDKTKAAIKAAHVGRAQRAAEDKLSRAQYLHDSVSKVVEEEFDFEDLRLIAVNAFANIWKDFKGWDRCIAFERAASSIGRSYSFVARWVLDFEANDGFFSEYKWGSHAKSAMQLADIDTFNKVREWARAQNGHRRGQPNLTVSKLMKHLETTYNIKVCRATAADYMHRFGGHWEAVCKGNYVDAHEEPHAIAQEKAFLSEYLALYQRGANYIGNIDKDYCKDISDWKIGELKHPRGFGFGGQLRAGHTGPVVVIFCDDEVCVFASDGERFCWRFSGCTKGQTPAKNRGSARHIARLVWEGGNGRLSLDHGGSEEMPPADGGLTKLEDMQKYIALKHAKQNSVLPRHADVMMKPGKNEEGWWAGLEKQMQMELACDIFDAVFNTDLDLRGDVRIDDVQRAVEATKASHDGVLPYKMAIQLDRSQNHLARSATALCATKMKKGRGVTNDGKNPHIRSTIYPRAPIELVPRDLICMPGCQVCENEIAELRAAGGIPDDFQSIGYKGIERTLQERGFVTRGKNLDDLVPTLAACNDFASELSAVQTILRDAGHVGFFGAVCHPELAYIEMKWSVLKSRVRPEVNDTDQKLVVLIKEAMKSIGVDINREHARHCRDAMHAYRVLRSAGSSCDPAKVKEIMGTQSAHRQPHANVSAGLIGEAGQKQLTAKEKQNVETTKTKRVQKKGARKVIDRSATRAKRQTIKKNNQRAEKKRSNKQ